jgi:formimidoylglutamate deiminase
MIFAHALLPTGIARNVALEVTADGTLARVTTGSTPPGEPVLPGLVVPGMPNLHSHAFQRAMAGTAETLGKGESSFWGWRQIMYGFVDRLELQDVAAIAAWVYAEMLESGYTAVAEFHYLHHRPDGSAYAEPAAMAVVLRQAAAEVGIRQLMLPSLYQNADFGDAGPLPAQRRFVQSTAAFLQLFDSLRASDTGLLRTGIALHSLRAVGPEALREVGAYRAHVAPGVPVHIHVAEQRREVDDCVAWSGRRPIAHLLDTGLVDRHWCLVHATHSTADELAGMARAGAVVGLCPSTECNLGDGLFALDQFLELGGEFGIGSDSQVCIDPRDELRTAEYLLRIARERRTMTASAAAPHCGEHLYLKAQSGGARAVGQGNSGLIADAPADLVVIDVDRPEWAGVPPAALLDAYLFAPRPGAIRDVMVGGRWVVLNGKHIHRDRLGAAYRACLARLRGT